MEPHGAAFIVVATQTARVVELQHLDTQWGPDSSHLKDMIRGLTRAAGDPDGVGGLQGCRVGLTSDGCHLRILSRSCCFRNTRCYREVAGAGDFAPKASMGIWGHQVWSLCPQPPRGTGENLKERDPGLVQKGIQGGRKKKHDKATLCHRCPEYSPPGAWEMGHR